MKTRDVRPWWWWLNPWLYIKRRDVAYDVALDTLRELSLDIKYPERNVYIPSSGPSSLADAIVSRCRDCNRKYIEGIVHQNARDPWPGTNPSARDEAKEGS